MSEYKTKDYTTRVEIPQDSVRWSKFIRTKNGGSRVELGDDPMRIGKLALKFQALDKNMKQTGRVTIYLDKDDARELAWRILEGGLGEPDKYGAYYTTDPMGTPASKLYGENSRNGKAEFRKFTLLKGDSAPYVMRASKCDGVEKGQGLIMPYTVGGKPQNATTIIVALTAKDLTKIALNIISWVSAYETAQMVITAMMQQGMLGGSNDDDDHDEIGVDKETGEVKETPSPVEETKREEPEDDDILYGDITSDDLPF